LPYKIQNKNNQMMMDMMDMMDRISLIRKKFSQLVILIFFIPFLIAIFSLLYLKNRDADFSRLELLGVDYHQAGYDVLIAAQRYRGLNFMHQNDIKIDDSLEDLRATFVEKINKVDQLGALCTPLKMCEQWNKIRAELLLALDGSQALSVIVRFEMQSQAIKNLSLFLKDIAQSSNLILDPETNTYFLAHISYNFLPSIIEEVGYIRGKTSGLLGKGFLEQHEISHFLGSYGRIENEKNEFVYDSGIIEKNLPDGRELFRTLNQDFIQKTDYFVSQYLALSTHTLLNMSPTAFFELGTQVIDAATRVYKTSNNILRREIQKRIDTQMMQIWFLVAGLLFTFAIASVSFCKLFQSANRDQDHQVDERFHSFINLLSQGMCVIDEHGVIQNVSPSAERIFGAISDNLTGKPLLDIIADKDQDRVANLFGVSDQGADAHADDLVLDLTGRRRNGELFAMQLELNSFVKNEHRFYIALVNDISSFKESAAA
jgi:PAS domain S-box-containing protein